MKQPILSLGGSPRATRLKSVGARVGRVGVRHFEGRRYNPVAFVVMNDHVHVLLSLTRPYRLEDVIHSWKSFTANLIQRNHGRRGRVWQDEYFDRIVRDDKEFVQKFKYIQGNPWSRWPNLQTYNWVWPVEGGMAGTEARPTVMKASNKSEAPILRLEIQASNALACEEMRGMELRQTLPGLRSRARASSAPSPRGA
jgi:REP element-mobilizing transposase RayT